MAIEVESVTQVVTLTNESLIGLDWHVNIVDPVRTGDRLIASSTGQGTVAYRLTRQSAPGSTSSASAPRGPSRSSWAGI